MSYAPQANPWAGFPTVGPFIDNIQAALAAAAVTDSDASFNSLSTALGVSAGADLIARASSATRVKVGQVGPSGQAGLIFGSADDTNLYRGSAGRLITDGVFRAKNTATSSSAFESNIGSEAQSRLVIFADGKLQWSDGTNPADTTLYRSAADTLKSDDLIHSQRGAANQGSFQTSVVGDPFSRLFITADGKMQWGSGAVGNDVNLYRSSVDNLTTDDNFNVGLSLLVSQGIFSTRTTAGATAFDSKVVGDAVSRFFTRTDGRLEWGDGTNARDVAVYRGAVDQLWTDDQIKSARSATNLVGFSTVVAGDANARWYVQADGRLQWGDGTNTVDTNLYRVGVDGLKTDDNLTVGLNFLLRGSTSSIVFDAAASSTQVAYASRVSGNAQAQFTMDIAGKQGWGDGTNAADTNLYRIAAGILATDNEFRARRSTAANAIVATLTTSTLPNFAIKADGKHEWGDGTNPADTFLYRGTPGLLQHDGELRAKTTTTAFATIRPTSTVEDFNISATGSLAWGDGTNARDTNLYRSSAGVLKTDQSFLALGSISSNPSVSTSSALSASVAGDATARYAVQASGNTQWGDGTNARDVILQRVNAGQLQLSNRLSVVNGSVGTAFSTIINGDTNSRYYLNHDGTMGWGPGNAAQDLTISRNTAGIMQFGAASQNFRILHFAGSASAIAHSFRATTSDVNDRFQIDASGVHKWGDGTNAADVQMYRGAANELWLDGNRLHIRRASTAAALSSQNSGDTFSRFIINSDGTIAWGPGNATQDTTLYRASADVIGTDDEVRSIRTSVGNISFAARTTSDTTSRWIIKSDGSMEWGDGTSTRDVTLYRSSADILATDDRFQIFTSNTGATALGSRVSSEATSRWVIKADGAIQWSDGTNPIDTTLYRAAADTLATDDQFWIKNANGIKFNDNTVQTSAAVSYAHPTGSIEAYAGFTAPSGWLFCDFAEYSRTTYANLFNAITFTLTGSTTNASAVVTGLSSTDYIRPGVPVEGTGIPAGTTVLSVDSATQVTLSANATATGTPTIRFFPYGNGNGSTTFNVPDSRGRSLTGVALKSAGGHADMWGMGGTEGAALANRRMKHSHGLGTIAIGASGGHTHGPGTYAISGGSHGHTINDPSHSHYEVQPGPSGSQFGTGGGPLVGSQGSTTGASYTGISINANTHSHPSGEWSGASASTTHTHATADFTGLVGTTTAAPSESAAYLVVNYIIKT